MDPNYYGLVELTLSFGVILAIGFWELWSLSRAKKKRRESLLPASGERAPDRADEGRR